MEDEKIKLKVWCIRKKQNYRVTNEDEKWRLRNEDSERKWWGVRNEDWGMKIMKGKDEVWEIKDEKRRM